LNAAASPPDVRQGYALPSAFEVLFGYKTEDKCRVECTRNKMASEAVKEDL